jgi:hypothetical protein
MASKKVFDNEQDYKILRDNGRENDYISIKCSGSNNMHCSLTFAYNNIAELIIDHNRKLKQAANKIREIGNTNDSTSRPSLTTPVTFINIDTLDNNVQKFYNYDDLAMPRLIRRQERQYIQYINQNKEGYHRKHILVYKTNLFTNRLFYNISSKILTKHEEHLLALGLKFTIDNHQTTDDKFMIQIEEYHKSICMTYDTVNMLRHTREEPNPETKRIQGCVKNKKIIWDSKCKYTNGRNISTKRHK